MNILNRSSLRIENGLPYFQVPEIAQLDWIKHGFLTRKGGVSSFPFDSLNLGFSDGDLKEHVLQNRSLIASNFQFQPEKLILLHQMHQDGILLLKEQFQRLPVPLEYDAVITNAPETPLGIRTADCIPIFVVDRKRKVIAAVHAGRQGTALRIVTKVLKTMAEEFSCAGADLLIAMGPSIGLCCYEVDKRVFQPGWEPFAIPSGEGRWKVDLARINIAQMKAEGIRENQIFRVDLCTHCHADLFFSYRRDGRTGRQLSFIGITGQQIASRT